MRGTASHQKACASEPSSNQSLSVLERAKLALAKANEAKKTKPTLPKVRFGQSERENTAPKKQQCPSAPDALKQDSTRDKSMKDHDLASTQKRPAAEKSAKPKNKKRKPLTEFEKTFGVAENEPEQHDAKDRERMHAMAGDMEWSLFSKECKRLAEQERIEERMANQMTLKVPAFHCSKCNTTTESRRPQCAGHDVKKVQAVKRWFRCGNCGNRTTSVARRFPAWRCDRCRMEDWHACSMYIIGKDKVAEIQNEIYGYGDSSLLKISGPDFDTRL